MSQTVGHLCSCGVIILFHVCFSITGTVAVCHLYFQNLALSLTHRDRVDLWDLLLSFLVLQVASIWDFGSWFREQEKSYMCYLETDMCVKVGKEQEDRWILKELGCGG